MAGNNQVAPQPQRRTSLTVVKETLAQDNVKKKFAEMLGLKAPQFMASIINVVSNNQMLKTCDPNSIIGAAFVAATYDLPIDSNLGFSAIVPYNNSTKNPETGKWEKHPVAQFQMMYKGFIQLAIRSGYYEKMNYAVIYKDELKSYNPITGEIEFVTDFSNCTMRDEGDPKNVVGYYAWFRLQTGFRQELFMTTEAVRNHAKKYSQSYARDLREKKQSSRWSTDFQVMALKTVIKLLLSKWGILSVDMQRAIQDDQKTFDKNGNGSYGDNKPEPIEAHDPFEAAAEQEGPAEPEPIDEPEYIEGDYVEAEVDIDSL